jgi:hypothetical protein
MIPLASNLRPFPVISEGRPFEVRQSARPTFFIWPHYNPVLKFSECPEVIVVPVDKIAWRCRRVTRRARQRPALGNKPSQARMLCSISRYTEVVFATKVELHRKKSAT